MEVVRFTDQYHLAAGLYDRAAEALRERDALQKQPVRRWLAMDNGSAVCAVSVWLRPDDRMFVSFAGDDASAIGPLTTAVAADLDRPVFVHVDATDGGAFGAYEAAGFLAELEEERFKIRFDRCLEWLDRAWTPSEFEIMQADQVDEDSLFTLDNTLRQDVPGCDGWVGDREWFREELAESPPFDPTAYLVAVETRTGEYAGLVRIWRNNGGPRLGLIGVVREHRGSPIALALLKESLRAASTWGHDTFVTETSPSNSVIYRRMGRLGATSQGRFFQMVRRP